MQTVRPKKHLGQHFLRDQGIAARIAGALTLSGDYKEVLEVGPGTGILTTELLKREEINLWAIEIDPESIETLNKQFPQLTPHILYGDFLHYNLQEVFKSPFGLIGNFPYNISSQIMFRVIEMRDQIPEIVGMFQREVAQRIAEPPGKKQYGILSVFLQAWYTIEYLFEVPPQVFYPPPKVHSAVIRLKRNEATALDCDEKLFVKVVKAAFSQRRKTLRNSLKTMGMPEVDLSSDLFNRRAETLSVPEFVYITRLFEEKLGQH